jgi:NADH dehydrogenase FAD-containing subunit
MTGKHLVLVGGGHAHLSILKQLKSFTSRGHRVTLVSPLPFHDYSGMGPSLLSGKKRLAEARFNIARMTTIRGGRFIEAAAVSIDPGQKTLHLTDGESINYDVISFNCGSEVTLPAPKIAMGKSIFTVKPIVNMYHVRQRIIEAARNNNQSLQLLVIGGGPAGCEVAGNLQALTYDEGIQATITLVTGPRLLTEFCDSTRRKTRKLLARHPLQLLEGPFIKKLQANQAELDDKRIIHFDYAIVASGISPPELFSNSPLPNQGEGLPVNDYLQSPDFPELFGGGDCIDLQSKRLKKVGVHAIRQSPVLRNNLLAALEGKPLQRFLPQKQFLLIFNLGLGRALATGYGISWTGFPALLLKSYLDRNFVKRFQ